MASQAVNTADEVPVLALDCATITGWALSSADGLSTGLIDLSRGPNQGPGYSFLAFDKELDDRFTEYAPEGLRVVIERPGYFKDATASILIGGLCWHARLWARMNRCHVTHYSPSTLKKWAVGHGHAPKTAMLRAARRKWPDIEILDHNQADALWLLEMATGGTPSDEECTIPS